MKRLEFARQFISNGISVIPLRHRGKEPESRLIHSWESYKTILSTDDEVYRWLGSGWQNYGVVCGWRDLVVIDFDDMTAFSMWFDWFALLNKHVQVYAMPYIVRSARGAHVYIACPTLDANQKRRGVDVKCHGYVVGPGSIHPNGTEYGSVTDFRLIDVFSIDTILPIDLFPKIVPKPSCGQIDGVFLSSALPIGNDLQTSVYDPMQAASFGCTDLIMTIKNKVRIETMFVSVQRTSADGRWLAALCPFHDDHHPSLWIDVKRQLCGCATCGMKPMDAINLYGRLHGLSDADAINAMAKELGIWG